MWSQVCEVCKLYNISGVRNYEKDEILMQSKVWIQLMTWLKRLLNSSHASGA